MAAKKADLVRVAMRLDSYGASAGTVLEVTAEEAARLVREGHCLPVESDGAAED